MIVVILNQLFVALSK